MNKIYSTNITLTLIATISFAILDFSLELDKFSGFVFYLYLAYFLIILSITNLIVGCIKYYKKKPSRKYFYSTIGGIISLLLLFGISSLLQ